MPRKIQRVFARPRGKTLVSLGDSYTFNSTLAVRPSQFHTERHAVGLRALGVPIKGRNFGISGNTTAQMLARVAAVTQFEVPDLVVLYGGANDVANGINAAGTQANLEAIVTALYAAGVRRVVLCGMHYLNFAASAGDTPTVQYAPWATLRAVQQAAVASRASALSGLGIVYCDLYAAGRAQMLATPARQGTADWHAAAGNDHPNAIGEQYIADAIVATVVGQAGWLDALKAA